MIWVLLQSESLWQRNDAITFFIYLCVSLYPLYFTVFMMLKTSFQNISKTLS